VEVAAGTTLALDACPEDWDPVQGADGDEIRVGMTGPSTGALASFGAIGEGMEMYFDSVNATDPVDGKNIVLVFKDDGYEAGRAVSNVEEMIDTEDIFTTFHNIGTPINTAIRPILDEACVPQLFNSSGSPIWGDPANWPWTVGNILSYGTESAIWCAAVVEEFGEGATVAALIMNNDFGISYKEGIDKCADEGSIEIVGEELHDQAAPDVTNELTTLTATGADVLIAGTTGVYCPQTAAGVAATEWRPRIYMSYTCNNLASFLSAAQDETGLLSDEGAGIRMTNSQKVCGDPQWDDDAAVIELQEILAEYGDVTCADGSFSTGVLYGQMAVEVLRDAAALPGGLNRVNLMSALWNTSQTNDLLLGGTIALNGVEDAYVVEAAQIQEAVLVDGALTFVDIGDLIDIEGESGTYES
jgi:branched-chain amino acid transport system substrate-binding protein